MSIAARSRWVVLGLVSLCALACEDPPKAETKPSEESTAAKGASPTATPTPAPTPSAEPAKAAPKPKKQLADCPKGPAVTFDEKGLEDEVRRKLPKPSGDITIADLKKLKSFNASQVKGIEQLDPCVFSHMTGLKELFLGEGTFDDLSPIAGATQLESLRASINQVSDLKPLSKLKKLDRLDLGRTQVKDLAPLAELTAITELQLDSTQVEDIAPLAKLTLLETLSLKGTKVKDLSPLEGLKKLKSVDGRDTPADEDPMNFAKLRGRGVKIVNQ
jgi:internalin A